MKVKVLEQFENKYLIQRYYRKLRHTEYVVCVGYNFKSNIFNRGVIVFSLPEAYRIFNYFCIQNELPETVEEIEEDGVFKGSDS